MLSNHLSLVITRAYFPLHYIITVDNKQHVRTVRKTPDISAEIQTDGYPKPGLLLTVVFSDHGERTLCGFVMTVGIMF